MTDFEREFERALVRGERAPEAWIGQSVRVTFQGAGPGVVDGKLIGVNTLVGITLEVSESRDRVFYPWSAIRGIVLGEGPSE